MTPEQEVRHKMGAQVSAKLREQASKAQGDQREKLMKAADLHDPMKGANSQ